MDIATSDWHLGDGGERDRADRDKVNRLIAVACEQRIRTLVLAGDIAELLKFSLPSIAKAHTGWLRQRGHDLAAARVRAVLLPGNHDGPRHTASILRWLQNDCGWQSTVAHAPWAEFGQFRVMHGHQHDPVCRDGWFQHVAGAAAWFVGNTIERVFPSLDESYANPVTWLSPACSDKRAGTIGVLAQGWAERHHAHLIMGHTHRHALAGGLNWSYYNTGALDRDAPFSYVVFDGRSATLVSDAPGPCAAE